MQWCQILCLFDVESQLVLYCSWRKSVSCKFIGFHLCEWDEFTKDFDFLHGIVKYIICIQKSPSLILLFTQWLCSIGFLENINIINKTQDTLHTLFINALISPWKSNLRPLFAVRYTFVWGWPAMSLCHCRLSLWSSVRWMRYAVLIDVGWKLLCCSYHWCCNWCAMRICSSTH